MAGQIVGLSNRQRRELVERYQAGESSPKLAMAFNCSNDVVRRVIREEGGEIRHGTDAQCPYCPSRDEIEARALAIRERRMA